MMQGIFLFIILFSTVYAEYHLGTYFKNSISDAKVHEEIYKHTYNSSKQCGNFKDQMKNATDDAAKCLHEHYDPDQHSICNFLLHNDFKECLKPVTSLLTSCLPTKSKDTPDFILNSFTALVRFFCNAKGSEILELTIPCITFSLNNENNTCRLMDYQSEFPTKREICNFEKSYRGCLEKLLQRDCESVVTISNFFKFFDAFYSPCKTIIKQ